jgi:hypothetical protein
VTSSATLASTDDACSNQASVCNANDTDSVPNPVLQLITNQSFETNTIGWQGAYNKYSTNTRVSGGYDGNYSMRSVLAAGGNGITGFTDKQYWVNGATGHATIAGKTYSATVWVKPDVAGQQFNFRLRELDAAGNIYVNKLLTYTATSTNWALMSNQLTPTRTGDQLSIHVYASNVATGQGFNADMLGLTTIQ